MTTPAVDGGDYAPLDLRDRELLCRKDINNTSSCLLKFVSCR
jgi:hypothetical protein